LLNAGVKIGAMGVGHVRIVSESEGIRSLSKVMDSPFRAFETEEEALSSLQERPRGCLESVFPFLRWMRTKPPS
jgi:hypothetical protein